MSAEERSKAFAHRINQLVGDHIRAWGQMPVQRRADLGSRIHSALEDAFGMGLREGYQRQRDENAQRARDLEIALEIKKQPLQQTGNDGPTVVLERVAERIEPQEP